MTNNKMNYLDVEADIHFDSIKMMLVGIIDTQAGPINFSATEFVDLKNEYELAVKRAQEIDELFQLVSKEVTSVSETIMSGEAKIRLNLNESDERIGLTIKLMMYIADGAGFKVQERYPS